MTLDVRTVLRNFITNNLSVSGWTTLVNPAWFEVNRQNERQIYLSTGDTKYISKTTHIQRDMDRVNSQILYQTTVFVYVAAPSETQRATMADAMRTLFESSDSHNPDEGKNESDEYEVNDMLIVSEFPQDKDKKNQCLAFTQIFEILILH